MGCVFEAVQKCKCPLFPLFLTSIEHLYCIYTSGHYLMSSRFPPFYWCIQGSEEIWYLSFIIFPIPLLAQRLALKELEPTISLQGRVVYCNVVYCTTCTNCTQDRNPFCFPPIGPKIQLNKRCCCDLGLICILFSVRHCPVLGQIIGSKIQAFCHSLVSYWLFAF